MYGGVAVKGLGAVDAHPVVLDAPQLPKRCLGWGCLLRYISDRIAPVIGPPRPAQGLPLTGSLPDLG